MLVFTYFFTITLLGMIISFLMGALVQAVRRVF